jgi:hypothetical protein
MVSLTLQSECKKLAKVTDSSSYRVLSLDQNLCAEKMSSIDGVAAIFWICIHSLLR